MSFSKQDLDINDTRYLQVTLDVKHTRTKIHILPKKKLQFLLVIVHRMH